jgi:GNAT superfamily N-acetyltransferase
LPRPGWRGREDIVSISLRPATDDDRAAICAVHVRAIRETCSRSYPPEQVSAWAGLLSPDSYSAVLRERVLVVATDGGIVIGFGQLDPRTREVDAVYVLPDRQGEGIGRLLLADLEARARALGIAILELSATLNAAPFYARAGYVRRHPAIHRLPTGADLEVVRMSKDL